MSDPTGSSPDELRGCKAIFWWGSAGLVLWGLVILLILWASGKL